MENDGQNNATQGKIVPPPNPPVNGVSGYHTSGG
jgi:hypothetical protein